MLRLASFLAFLALAAPTQAATPQPYDPQVAFKRATVHFRSQAHCSAIQVTYLDFPKSEGGIAWGEIGGCQVWMLGREQYRPDWTEFCGAMIHEYGHLLGYLHSSDQYDIMYPSASIERSVVPECYKPKRKLKH